jgi:hypothetical protein
MLRRNSVFEEFDKETVFESISVYGRLAHFCCIILIVGTEKFYERNFYIRGSQFSSRSVATTKRKNYVTLRIGLLVWFELTYVRSEKFHVCSSARLGDFSFTI